MPKKVTITFKNPVDETNVDHLEVWWKLGAGGTYAQLGSDIPFVPGTADYVVEDTSNNVTDGANLYYEARAYSVSDNFNGIESYIVISSTVSNGLLPMSDFYGHENSTITSVNIPSITKKNATGEAPFILSVNASTTTCVGTRNKSGAASNPLLDLDTRWTLTHLGGAPIDFKNDSLMVDSNGVSVNPYTDQFGPAARFVIREPGQYTLTQTSKGDDGAGGFVTDTFSETITVSANTQTHRWYDGVAGDDANDGLDPHGFALTSASYTDATRTLTKAGSFTSLTLDNEYPQHSANFIHLTGGTGIVAGLYEIESKIDNDSIVLKTSAGADASDVTSSNGPLQTFDNIAVSGRLKHVKGGQIYTVLNTWTLNGQANDVGVVGYGGIAEIRPDVGSAGLIDFTSNIAGFHPSQVYFGNIDYNCNDQSGFFTSNAAQSSTSDTTLSSYLFDNITVRNSPDQTPFSIQSGVATKPIEILLWNVDVQNRYQNVDNVTASNNYNFVDANSTGIAFTGWAGAGDDTAVLDYTADPGILDFLLVDDVFYLTHATEANKTWVVTGAPTGNTVAVRTSDGSDAFNSAAGGSHNYKFCEITVDSMPAGAKSFGVVLVTVAGRTIPLPYHKYVGNRFYMNMYNRVVPNYTAAAFSATDTLQVAEHKAQGMFTMIEESDGYMGAVGIKVSTDSLQNLYEHTWYENGKHDNLCITCIETDSGDWTGFALNINQQSATGGDKRELTSITNFKFRGGEYGVDASNSYNDVTGGRFGDLYIARGSQIGYKGFCYQGSTERVRIVGVNHHSYLQSPEFYRMSTQSMADPENFGAVISRCRINDNDITKYDNPGSLEVWDVVATNSEAAGYMIDIRPGTDDPLSHQLVYDSELHLSANGSPTPYVLNGSFVNLSTFNAGSGGGNTNQNPNFVDPANGDFTIVILAPVLGTLDLPAAEVGVAYSFFVNTVQTGGNSADTWALETGTMGNGLTFDPVTTEISGTPVAETDLTGLSFTATNAGGSATTNTDDLVTTQPALELLFNDLDIYANITLITGMVTGDTVSLVFNTTGDLKQFFDGNSGSSSNRLSARSEFNRLYLGGCTATIDGTPIASAGFMSQYYDGNDHTLVLTVSDNNGRDIDRIGRSKNLDKYANGVIKEFEVDRGGTITRYEINSGSTTTEAASVGTGTMTFVNVDAGDWI